MAQKARFLVLALAVVLPLAAQAGERHERAAPIVLNGRLNTADFTGGVGYGGGAMVYVQGYSYGGAASGSSAFAATQAFVAGARASAFASAGTGHH